LAERGTNPEDLSIAPLFFTIDIEFIMGVRANPREESDAAAK
jgi:hypothetical protein